MFDSVRALGDSVDDREPPLTSIPNPVADVHGATGLSELVNWNPLVLEGLEIP